MPKIIKISQCFMELFKKEELLGFSGHV